MLLNTQNLTTLFQSYNAAFKAGFGSAKATWQQVATEVPSGTEANLYAFLGHFPKLREWVGDRILKDLRAYDYTLTNKDFEASVEVPKPKIEDDTYGVFAPLMQEMGYAAAMHPDELIYALAAAGATELCFDGQAFFSASHPVKVNGAWTTVSNYDSAGGGNLWMLLDTKRPLKPFIFQKRQDYKFQALKSDTDEHVFMRNRYVYGVDARVVGGFGLWHLAYGSVNTLSANNFDAAVTAMMSLKSDEDKPLGVRPNLLVVGPSRRAAARDLVDLSALASGASNPNYKEVDILVTPYLT